MSKFETLSAAFAARRDSNRSIYYIEGEHNERKLPLPELHARAIGLLHHFQSSGAVPGSEMIVFVDSNEQFIDAFWACMLGNIVAVPLAPGINDEHRWKFLRVLRRLKRPHLCSDEKTFGRLAAFAAANDLTAEIERLKPVTVFLDHVDDITRPGEVQAAQPDDIAFVQYSSGSTSEPKGVALSHRNLVTNIAAIIRGAAIEAQDSTLSWMPLTHDMGLIGFHLTPLFADVTQYLMQTTLFVRRPQLWLAKAADTHATLLCSPNFGYRHFLKTYKPETSPGLDLSSVRIIFNGAEPISVDLCTEFMVALAPSGLKATAMFPVYGLAEASLAVAFPPPGVPYSTVTVDRETLSVGAVVGQVPADHAHATTLACVGAPVKGCAVRIGSEHGHALPDNTVGRVLIRGDNVTRGYYQDLQSTRELISSDGWLDTGDLGFVSAAGLVVTGRLKDILFVSGQNYYPQDFEAILERHAGIELGKAAVCGVRPAQTEADEVLIFVLYRGELDGFVPLARRVRRCINEQIGIVVGHVIPASKIPKTTSGKIQRYVLAQAYLAGEYSLVVAALEKLVPQAQEKPAAASSKIEKTLKEICDTFLKDKPLGINDNIFELGTSSLTLAQIHQRIDSAYPGQIEVTDFFDYPTIAELARYLEKRLAAV